MEFKTKYLDGLRDYWEEYTQKLFYYNLIHSLWKFRAVLASGSISEAEKGWFTFFCHFSNTVIYLCYLFSGKDLILPWAKCQCLV